VAYVVPDPNSWITDPPQSIGDGQCVAFVRNAAAAPETAKWIKGASVKANIGLKSGTAIATFDDNGKYGNHTDGRSHAAIYLGQDAHGLRVIDQWVSPVKNASGKVVDHKRQPVHIRIIRFWHKGHVDPVNDGNVYNVID
jgi:hypothetical protein